MALTKQQKNDSLDLGNAIESGRIRAGAKGPTLAIGPNMGRGNVKEKKEDTSRSLLNLSKASPSDKAESRTLQKKGSDAAKSYVSKTKQAPDYGYAGVKFDKD
jgi:hypothetical protein